MLLHDVAFAVLAFDPEPGLVQLAAENEAKELRAQELVTSLTFALAAITPVIFIAVLEFIDRDVSRWVETGRRPKAAGWSIFAYLASVASSAAVIAFTFYVLLLSVPFAGTFGLLALGGLIALVAPLAVVAFRVVHAWRIVRDGASVATANAPTPPSPARVQVTNLPPQQVVTTSTTVATASLIAGTFLAVGGLILAAGRFTPPRR